MAAPQEASQVTIIWQSGQAVGGKRSNGHIEEELEICRRERG